MITSDSLTARLRARPLLFGALATFGLTAVHHVYGGVRYGTPWRIHGAVVALVLGLVLSGVFSAYQRNPGSRLGRVAGWALTSLAVVLAVLIIGLFEGAYNHVLKVVLFLAGAPRDLLQRLYPPPAYELPNDAAFEISGVAQVVPAAFTALAALRFVRALRRGRSGDQPGASRLVPGAVLAERRLLTTTGEHVRVPEPGGLVHLQFRRFAGCPVCNLHLRSLARRHEELRAAGVREVVVFHSAAAELRPHVAELPFAVVADPDKRLYAAFGVESAPRALLDPRAWPTLARAVARSLVAVLRGRERAPAANPRGGRLGLPAEFLVSREGRVVACKYGRHADDQWTVDELLALAGADRAWAPPAPGEPSRASTCAGPR